MNAGRHVSETCCLFLLFVLNGLTFTLLGDHSTLLCGSLLTLSSLPGVPGAVPRGLGISHIPGGGGAFVGHGRQLAKGACGGRLCQCLRGIHMAKGQSSTHTSLGSVTTSLTCLSFNDSHC